MLRTVSAVLIGVWLIGVLVGVTIGGFIHVLLVVAVVALLLKSVSGLRPYDY